MPLKRIIKDIMIPIENYAVIGPDATIALDFMLHQDGLHITGVTPVGQATVDALLLNHERRIKIRQAEALFDLFPPPDAQSSS